MLAEAGGVTLVVAAALALAARGPPESYDWATFRRTQVLLWLFVAAVFTWLVGVEGGGLASLNQPPVGDFAPSAALAFVAVGFTGIVTGLAMRRTGSGTDPATRALLELPRSRGLVLVVATAVGEELVFRGYLLTRVATLSGSDVVAVVVSAAVFTAFRAPGRTRGQVLQVAVLGTAVAAAFAYTGNLFAVVAARVGYDALTTLSTDPDDLRDAERAQS